MYVVRGLSCAFRTTSARNMCEGHTLLPNRPSYHAARELENATVTSIQYFSPVSSYIPPWSHPARMPNVGYAPLAGNHAQPSVQ